MNLKLSFRPLVGGLGIVPSTRRRWATLGLIAEGDGQRWLLTACHALGDLSYGTRLAIHQGPSASPGAPICDADASDVRQDFALDAAAVPLVPSGVGVAPEVIGLGRVGVVRQAVQGETVIRVGVETGLVRGNVDLATPGRIEIVRPANYPTSYSVGEPGDSGAVWLSYPDLDLIGLHIAKSHGGFAIASPLDAVLASLRLAPLQ